MNKVIISGRLTRDPEIRYSQAIEPLAITRFSVAVNRRFKKEGEPDADFLNCVAFGKTGEFISKYFTKGKMIGVTGSIRTGSWVDQTGQKRYSTEIFVEEAEFLESKAASEQNANNYQAPKDPQDAQSFEQASPESNDFYSIESDVNDDDLPF